jgi:hypothetical protein
MASDHALLPNMMLSGVSVVLDRSNDAMRALTWVGQSRLVTCFRTCGGQSLRGLPTQAKLHFPLPSSLTSSIFLDTGGETISSVPPRVTVRFSHDSAYSNVVRGWMDGVNGSTVHYSHVTSVAIGRKSHRRLPKLRGELV